jgi:RNA polymerase sigma factor (sigma-70 family)
VSRAGPGEAESRGAGTTAWEAPTYEAHIELIERIIAATCRQHRLRSEEAEDFASWARERLLDGKALGRFQGRCQLQTFLVIVVRRLFLDYRNVCWGKYRPSAEAKRLGSVAVLLERLLVRDGHSFNEAVEIILTNFALPTTRDALYELASKLPVRVPRRIIGDEAIDDIASDSSHADAAAFGRDRRELRDRVSRALQQVLQSLEAQDRLLLKMRFEDGLPLATIARALQLEQKALYRRFERLIRALRAALGEHGVGPDDVSDILAYPEDGTGGAAQA